MRGRGLVRVPPSLPLRQARTLAELAPGFLRWLQFVRMRAPITVASYRFDLRTFLEFAARAELEMPDQVDFRHIEFYLGYLRAERGNTATTANHHLFALRAFFGYLVREGLATRNPAAEVFFLPEPFRLPHYLTIPEQQQVLTVLAAHEGLAASRDLALVSTGLFTGLRCSELARLQLTHVDFEAKILRVIQGKGGKDRELPMAPRLERVLRPYIEVARPQLVGRPFGKIQPPRGVGRKYWHVIQRVDRTTRTYSRALSREDAERVRRELMPPPPDSPYVFVHTGNQWRRKHQGRPLGSRAIYRMIREVIEPIVGRPVHPHMLRHSFATRLRTNGADLQIIQEALGHANINTTTMYAHLATPKRLAELTRFLE